MRISCIVAVDPQGTIGKDGGLPWRIPEDLQHFKARTMGKPILMGRRTHESIGRALPGRENIVLSRQAPAMDGCILVRSLDEGIARAEQTRAEELVVIGGGEIYAEALPRCSRIYRTLVLTPVVGDTFFPALDDQEWELVSREDHSSAGHHYSFDVLERRSPLFPS